MARKSSHFTFRKSCALAAAIACLLQPLRSTAASITKNYTFSSGQTASASAVNSNFDQLFTKVNSLDAASWSVNGTSYYYSGGNVGFGTSTPLANIHSSVSRSQTNFGGGTATPLAIFENPDTSQGQQATRLSIYNNNNNVNGTLVTQEYYNGASWATHEQSHIFLGKWGGTLGMNDRDALNGGNGVKVLLWQEGIAGEGTVMINAAINPGVPSNLMVYGSTAMGTYAGTSSAPANGLIVSGSVGIGDDTPGFKLDVNGTIRGFGITDSSDLRLKKDVSSLQGDYEKIASLEGVSFYWQDKNIDPEKQIGLIAQQVEKVYPELVKHDEKGVKSVNYSHLVAPLIEAFKTMQAKTTALEAENAALKVRLDKLEKAVGSR